jgi:hypothetical protein
MQVKERNLRKNQNDHRVIHAGHTIVVATSGPIPEASPQRGTVGGKIQ